MSEEITSDSDPAAELLFFNGINGDSGEYDLPPMTGTDLYEFIKGESPPENLSELRYRYRQDAASPLEVREGIDQKLLGGEDGSGWGVIFAKDADPAIKEALSELLDLRREQAGDRFRIYEGSDGYRSQDSKNKFLARHKAGPGPADPTVVPYYLLIVGSPQEIPYRFQTQLDVQYAVGRLHFQTLDEYAAYGRSVVEAETGLVKLPKDVKFFGVANDNDRATQLSSSNLVQPIQAKLQAAYPDWSYSAALRENATKAQLSALIGGPQTPALLFTASHGLSFANGSERQLKHQGALLCQDWPGPRNWSGPISQDHYFAGDDLASDASLLGMIAFFFACYGGGTPEYDEFYKQAFRDRSAIAPYPFVADLPTRMLGHPRGGALAVIGHIERAWGYSFMWPGAGAQTAVFEDTMLRLLDGYPIGAAIEFFNERYSELSTVLVDELEEIEEGDREADPYELAGMWTANNDARGYAILGDPAVRLPVVAGGEVPVRPVIAVQPLVTGEVKPAISPGDGRPAAEGEVAPASPESFDEISFALGLERSSLVESLKGFTGELAKALGKAADDLSSLEISTYTSDKLEEVTYDYERKKLGGGAKLQAITRIAFDGDTQVCVPQKEKGIDQELWKVHMDMVKQSQENRTAFLQSMAELAARLIEILKP